MNSDRQQAIDYLRAPVGGPWRWTENGTVLAWRDGSTIAFREEIVQIIEWLAPHGLPSFGAIVFLLAACRGHVPSVDDILVESNAPLPVRMGDEARLLLSARTQLRTQLAAALKTLEWVSRLPAETIAGIKARCVLAEAVFEAARAERYVGATMVVRGLRGPMDDAGLLDSERLADGGNVIRQIHVVAEGLKPHTAQSLLLRLRTGLDALPKESGADLPAAERARQLIEELGHDRELGAVGRASRELMAAVRLPRRLGERGQLATGGVADITNRGPLDRLLLSELAHDDLTLSVRVALNEALYLRREPPMREPPGTLSLLLDSGVRLWGVPRVLATAVALAMAARGRPRGAVAVWRAGANQLHAVDLLSREGLVRHLGSLEAMAHPGDCLRAFAGTLSSGGENQSVVVTHRDTLADPEFRRSLEENDLAAGFVATVDRDGHFELHVLPIAHRPPACAADLDVASIFADPNGVSPIRAEVDPDLPAIFGVRPFPFLLPVAGVPGFWAKTENGDTCAVLNERSVVRFHALGSGARFLTDDLPGGKILWMECVAGAVHLVKAGAGKRPARLVSLSPADGSVQVVDLGADGAVRAVHRDGDVILVIRDAVVRAHSLLDGRPLGSLRSPHHWIGGRYFRGKNGFHFVVWDGAAVVFETVTLPNAFTPPVISLVFDRAGMSGPWLVHHDGTVMSTAGGERLKLPMPPTRAFGLEEVRISRDGHRVYGAVKSMAWGRHLDLVSGRVLDTPPARSGTWKLDVPPDLPTWNLFRAIKSIAKIRDGIAIRGRNGCWRKLTLADGDTLRIVEVTEGDRGELGSQRDFPAARSPARHGCSLQKAEWPSGSRVYLDSRGLLHLKSANPAVPEISLVLSVWEVAGWTSDGGVCGPRFFFDGPHPSEAARVFGCVSRFLDHL